VRSRTRADMYKNITPDYYGYRDEDDGLLLVKEAAREVRTHTQTYTCIDILMDARTIHHHSDVNHMKCLQFLSQMSQFADSVHYIYLLSYLIFD
jgi:hypothetical protein